MKNCFLAGLLCGLLVVTTVSNSKAGSMTPPNNAVAVVDTLQVSAPQVKVAEVIAAIGRRLEYENNRIADYEYTTLVTQVTRDQPGESGGNYEVLEIAQRFHHNRELGDQMVQLWQRKRKYENGELVDDKTDEKVKADFVSTENQIAMAMPFSPGSADRYNYTIKDRHLVGNNLIYKIGFEPKSRFEALPSGTVWVDYSNWVLRKVEAHMTGAVPYPMFLKSVPVYRQSQERFGEFWFPTEVYLRINLRKLPLLPIPDNVEVRVSLSDIVINGESRLPTDTAPATGAIPATPDEIASGFWLSEEANADSLSAYWEQMGKQWDADVSPEAVPVSLSPSMVDSLNEIGDVRLQDLRTGRLWRVKADWTIPPSYNRVQGFVPRLGLSLAKPGPFNPRLDLKAGYAFANQRPVFAARLALPLVRSRWTFADHTDAGQIIQGDRYELLSLALDAHKDSALFAGDGRRNTRSATAFFYGHDPNQYYEDRALDVALKLRLSRGFILQVGAGLAQHRAWAQRTSWNLLGQGQRTGVGLAGNNLAADNLDDTRARAGAVWKWGALALAGDVIWHDIQNTTVGAGSLREMRFDGELDLLDKFGNQWLLRGGQRIFDRTAPVQWKSWLGDQGTLRGYQAGELTGDSGAHASLDARFGFDIWQAVRAPLLKDWGLQPIGFIDWGKTWDSDVAQAPAPNSDEGARGWRMDVGFGFGKRFDLPGLGNNHNLRLYAAHPVAEGSGARGWRAVLAFER